MKRLLIVIVILVIFGAVALALLSRTDRSAGTSPAIAGAPASAAAVARGEYLLKAADCVACHTAGESGKPFAGGVAFKLPFGTIYSSNITPDPTYGIGSYTDDEFVRAVREGIRRDGKHLYPAFPYTSYTQLSRDDVLAIKAYLWTLPPVAQPSRANELGFPFNQRWGMILWDAAFHKSSRFTPDPTKSAQWNSGAYLATALGHCGECHTPRNLGFGLEHGRELSGEELQGWRAYNITADSQHGIGSWTRRSNPCLSRQRSRPLACLGRRPHARGGVAQSAIPESRRRDCLGDLPAHRTGPRRQTAHHRRCAASRGRRFERNAAQCR